MGLLPERIEDVSGVCAVGGVNTADDHGGHRSIDVLLE